MPDFDSGFFARMVQNYVQGGRETSSARGAQGSPLADPTSQLANWHMGMQDAGRMLLGVIVDGTAIANCYRVQLEKGMATVLATATAHGSAAALGATEITTYAPGTAVIVMMHDRNTTGYIIGSVPGVIDVGLRSYHDYISQASRKRVDDAHKKYLKAPQGGGIIDFSTARPLDATLASEWGAISTTGMGISLDDFMVRLSVNEFCGVFGFYHDQLLRVAGQNMQVWTAGHEREAFMDQAEYNDTQGYSPYPWEALGLLQPGVQMVQEYSPATYQSALDRPYYAHWENKHEFQQPYHRTQQFFGYLGQGSRNVVHAPPPGLTRWTYKTSGKTTPTKAYDSAAPNTSGTPTRDPGQDKETDHQAAPVYGLHEDNVGLDGRRFIASAKGIVLSKRTLLPVPQRVKRPEDTKGGDEASKNYKAGSKYGDGPDHKITGDIKTTDEKWPNLQRAAAVLDLHGYLFNYSGIHPFYWHAKDYKTWEQSELAANGYAQVNQRVPDFTTLRGSMYLPEPASYPWLIDHRYGEQNFYEAESFVSLLEDGSVVIGDGYGAEIRMAGGSMTLSAPGDVWIKSGRHAQLWAGGDCIMRAHDNVDISATENSVRVKSEKHVMVLAGNSGVNGGILLESRSNSRTYDFDACGDDVYFGGVVLRAPKSNVVTLSNQLYLRTAGVDGGQAGDVVIDADEGKKDIITKSKDIHNYIAQSGSMYHYFGLDNAQKANKFSEQLTLLSGIVGTEKHLFADGGIFANGSVFVAKGHIFTQGAAKNQFVLECDGACQAQVLAAENQFKTLIDKTLPQLGRQLNDTVLKGKFYGGFSPGNKDVINKMEFSFRTDDQYKIPDFLLYEDRWQQMAAVTGQTSKTWTEKGVKSKTCDMTYPFPGKKMLTEEKTYVQQQLGIVEAVGGGLRDVDRGAAPSLDPAYKTPEFSANDTTRKKLNGNYPIIGRS
jgi:hypothetical protein